MPRPAGSATWRTRRTTKVQRGQVGLVERRVVSITLDHGRYEQRELMARARWLETRLWVEAFQLCTVPPRISDGKHLVPRRGYRRDREIARVSGISKSERIALAKPHIPGGCAARPWISRWCRRCNFSVGYQSGPAKTAWCRGCPPHRARQAVSTRNWRGRA